MSEFTHEQMYEMPARKSATMNDMAAGVLKLRRTESVWLIGVVLYGLLEIATFSGSSSEDAQILWALLLISRVFIVYIVFVTAVRFFQMRAIEPLRKGVKWFECGYWLLIVDIVCKTLGSFSLAAVSRSRGIDLFGIIFSVRDFVLVIPGAAAVFCLTTGVRALCEPENVADREKEPIRTLSGIIYGLLFCMCIFKAVRFIEMSVLSSVLLSLTLIYYYSKARWILDY